MSIVMLVTVFTSVSVMPANALEPSSSLNNFANTNVVVKNGIIGELDYANNRIQGFIICEGFSINYDCIVNWHELNTDDMLDGTIVADISQNFSAYDIVNISIGKNREAAMNSDNHYSVNDVVFKIVLYDDGTNTFYSAVSPVSSLENDLIIQTIVNSATLVSANSNANLFTDLIAKEKWYNTIFRYNNMQSNVMTLVEEEDSEILSSSLENSSINDASVSGITFDNLINKVGESKFKTANKIYNPGVVTNDSSYYGYYMETLEGNNDIVISYIIYYALAPNITRNAASTPDDGYAGLSMTIFANHEVWYYPNEDEIVNMGESQYRIRNVEIGISLSDNNDDFIWKLYEEAHTESGITQLPDFGVLFKSQIGAFVSAGISVFNTLTQLLNAYESGYGGTHELPLDPVEHFDQCDGYLRVAETRVEQGFDNNWFIRNDNRVLLQADIYSDNSSDTKQVTFYVKYEVCFPNLIGWYNTIETVEEAFSKNY